MANETDNEDSAAIVESEDRNVLSVSDILGASDLEPVMVHVPEWKGYVYIRPLSAKQLIDFMEKNKGRASASQGAVDLLILSACDENGKLMFNNRDDVARVQRKGLKPIMRLQKAAFKLNGMGDDDEVDIIRKND